MVGREKEIKVFALVNGKWNNNVYLDNWGWEKGNYATVRLYMCSGGNNQKWTLETVGSDLTIVAIKSKHSGKCLDRGNGKIRDNAFLYDCNQSGSQQWRVKYGAGKAMSLQPYYGPGSKQDEVCLQADGATVGTYVRLQRCNNDGKSGEYYAQKFYIGGLFEIP
ncbi:hypothetical protein HDU79_000564 [Rhizoclosmatium sp. JEL0117]|nr:hypothetical protein HDU79_000564 [Rhizoclosmatium sp. JEL0117]